jgi:hypothetical protein
MYPLVSGCADEVEGLEKTVEPWVKGMWGSLDSVLGKLRAGQLWTPGAGSVVEAAVPSLPVPPSPAAAGGGSAATSAFAPGNDGGSTGAGSGSGTGTVGDVGSVSASVNTAPGGPAAEPSPCPLTLAPVAAPTLGRCVAAFHLHSHCTTVVVRTIPVLTSARCVIVVVPVRL